MRVQWLATYNMVLYSTYFSYYPCGKADVIDEGIDIRGAKVAEGEEGLRHEEWEEGEREREREMNF